MNSLFSHHSCGLDGWSAASWTEDLPFHLLNDTEKECLRLVDQGYTSQRIANARGVRRDTIDKILRAARDKIGDITRRELARRLVEHERLQKRFASCTEADVLPVPPAETVGVQTVGLAHCPAMSSSKAPVTPNEGEGGASPPMMVMSLIDLSDLDVVGRLLFGSDRSPRNELDAWSKTAVICIIAAGAAFVAVAVMPLLLLLDWVAARL